MKPVPKRGKNLHLGSLYARAEDIEKMLDPLIGQHGFSVSTSTEDSPQEGQTRFVLVLRHESGHSERYHMDAPLDNVGMGGKTNKTKIQGLASSFTFCRRQLKCERV